MYVLIAMSLENRSNILAIFIIGWEYYKDEMILHEDHTWAIR